jgi:hypothetical protein
MKQWELPNPGYKDSNFHFVFFIKGTVHRDNTVVELRRAKEKTERMGLGRNLT